MLDAAMSQPVKFSGHAQERLAASRRTLSETEMTQLNQAVDQAAAKGSRDALILMRDLALVVSVKNRTVITAVDGDRMKENVFTNIDSAVIVNQ
jgi:flagellar operon protein